MRVALSQAQGTGRFQPSRGVIRGQMQDANCAAEAVNRPGSEQLGNHLAGGRAEAIRALLAGLAIEHEGFSLVRGQMVRMGKALTGLGGARMAGDEAVVAG